MGDNHKHMENHMENHEIVGRSTIFYMFYHQQTVYAMAKAHTENPMALSKPDQDPRAPGPM